MTPAAALSHDVSRPSVKRQLTAPEIASADIAKKMRVLRDDDETVASGQWSREMQDVLIEGTYDSSV